MERICLSASSVDFRQYAIYFMAVLLFPLKEKFFFVLTKFLRALNRFLFLFYYGTLKSATIRALQHSARPHPRRVRKFPTLRNPIQSSFTKTLELNSNRRISCRRPAHVR